MSRSFDSRLIPARPNFAFEKKLWKAGLERVAGLDEAGRGALAGPVFAGAVLFAQEGKAFSKLRGVRDSKEMQPAERERWGEKIMKHALDWAVGSASAEEIDRWGIMPSTRLAMKRALDSLEGTAEHLLIDALVLPNMNIPQGKLIKGDQRSLSIAAASVLAKVHRDAEMGKLALRYPGYQLGKHKGYGTFAHRKQIFARGPCPIHRKSFRLLGEE